MTFWNDLKQHYRMAGIGERLIYWNVALFAIPFVLNGLLSLFSVHLPFMNWVALPSDWGRLLYKPWTLLTYGFFHAGFFHLLFNMLVLHFSQRMFLTFFNPRQLLGVYLLGLLAAALVFLLSYSLFPRFSGSSTQMIGASGAVMAVLLAITTYQPQMPVRLLLIGTVKLWQIAAVFLVLDVIRLAGSNAGGHLAHLGGALLGYVFIKMLEEGRDWSRFLKPLFEPRSAKSPKRTLVTVHRNKSKTKEVANDKRPSRQQEVDAILDKISKSGYESLSAHEKEVLFKAKDEL